MIASRKITITIPTSWWAQDLLWLAFAACGFLIGILTLQPGIGGVCILIAIVGVLINTGVHLNRRGQR